MASAYRLQETCSCGATLDISSTSTFSSLSNEARDWRANHRHVEVPPIADGTRKPLDQSALDGLMVGVKGTVDRITRFREKMPSRADALIVPTAEGTTPCWDVASVERAMAELYR